MFRRRWVFSSPKDELKDREAAAEMSNESPPLVSIIVPVFNGERYLRESLDSILAQTYQHTEVLVMDDASTDSTPDIIASYDGRVKYYRQPQNKGQYQNHNEAMDMVNGKYIAIYHADDIYEHTIVEREVDFFESHSEVGAVFCHDIFVNAQGCEYGRLTIPAELRALPTLTYPVIFNAVLTHKNVFFSSPSSMVRASVYKDVGPYRAAEFDIASDLEMWLRIGRKYQIAILPEHLIRYRHGHGNWTQRYFYLRTEEEKYFQIMDLYLSEGDNRIARPEALRAYEAHRAEDMLMLAINHYILGKKKEAFLFLNKIKARHILRSPVVQRTRLLALLFALKVLLRIPRISLFADAFYRRWHVKKYAV